MDWETWIRAGSAGSNWNVAALNGGSRGLLITEFEMECANIECYSLHEIGIPIDRREVVRFGSHTGHLCGTDIGIILCLNRCF